MRLSRESSTESCEFDEVRFRGGKSMSKRMGSFGENSSERPSFLEEVEEADVLEDPNRSSSRARLEVEGKIQVSGSSRGGLDPGSKSFCKRSPADCEEKESCLAGASLVL